VRPNARGGIFRDHAARRMIWEQQKTKVVGTNGQMDEKWMKNG
jgi:hypothetical protein